VPPGLHEPSGARRCQSDPLLGSPCPDMRPEIGPYGALWPEGMLAWAWHNDRKAGARTAGPCCLQENAKNDRTEPSTRDRDIRSFLPMLSFVRTRSLTARNRLIRAL
jgi:hypothetical protein